MLSDSLSLSLSLTHTHTRANHGDTVVCTKHTNSLLIFLVLNPRQCVKGLVLWRNDYTVVNDELYKGYYEGNPDGKINEISAG